MQNLADTRERFDALIAAFAAAEYVVDAGARPIVVELGHPNPALDRLLDGRGWAIITAHNPGGQLQSRARNTAAHARLEQWLDRIAPAICLPTHNRDPAGQWPDEPGWLFTPAVISQADRLARRFGQRAIVAGGSAQPTHLRIYGADCAWLPDFARAVRA